MAPASLTLPLSTGGHLAGDYDPAAETNSAFIVLWVHGFGSHRGGEKAAAVREECRRRGWAFAAFDFRGHGESSGEMHELRASGLLADLEAIRHFLASRGHSRLGLVGSSMGGFAAGWFARAYAADVVGCVLLAPAFAFLARRWDRLTSEEREEWRRTDRLPIRTEWAQAELGYGLIEEREQFREADLAAGWKLPTLVFHGWADNVVPATDSLDFLRQVDYPRVELRLFKDGDHRLTAYKDEIAAESGRFFARLLAESVGREGCG
jgi:alpha-beta hydrolase superfamily lysophospholipase